MTTDQEVAVEQDPTDPTGVRETSSTLQPDTTRARNRKAWAAVETFFESHNWDLAAEMHGYPDGRAAQLAAERVMEAEAKENPRSLALMRNYAGRRLERLLRARWPDAVADSETSLASHDRALRTIDRWIKLYGLDAPTEVIVHSPTQDQIEAFVARVVTHGRPEPVGGDIFDEDADDSEVIDIEVIDESEVSFSAVAPQP